jgi:hypothetical protein
VDTIEAIGEVNLDELHRAEAGISSNDLRDDAFQSAPKLHRFPGRQLEGLAIHVGECIIDDVAGASLMLRDDANGRDSEVLEVSNFIVRKHGPYCLLHHIGHLLAQEILEFMGGLVWASGDGCVLAGSGPGRGLYDNGSSSDANVLEESLCWVLDILKGGEVSSALLLSEVLKYRGRIF